METSELKVIGDLVAAGFLDDGDVAETNPSRDRNQLVAADAKGRLDGGDGDDLYRGADGTAETFFFFGRHDNNDEGRYVNVIENFSLTDGDRLAFRLDGGFFKQADGIKIDQTTNGNQASFEGARDLADLLLFVNGRGGTREGLGRTISEEDVAAATNPRNGKVDGQFRKDLQSD